MSETWEPICAWRFICAVAILSVPLAAGAQGLPDPTEPTRATADAPAGGVATRWLLQSTLVANDRRIATVNGMAVAVGDTVDGARVLRIDPYAVRIRTANGIIVLTLSDGDPKQVAQGGPSK